VLIALNLQQYWHIGWTGLALIGAVAIPLMALVCGLLSRRQACRALEAKTAKAAAAPDQTKER
jgi:hypothetical protein